MIAYQAPVYRPSYAAIPRHRPNLGAIKSLGVTDWLLLFGAAIVGGAGANMVIGGLTTPNMIAVLVGGVVALVGLTVFIQKLGLLTA